MARIVVLGAGVMGSAFCLAPFDTGQEVRLVGTHLDRDIIDSIAESRRHPRLGIALPEPIQPYHHDRLTDALSDGADLIGVETCAAFKNLYALVIGAAAGLLDRSGPAENAAQMHNPAASLFAQAVVEMRLLNAWMGGADHSVFGMPGTGDLYVTCQGGRNSRMGRLLGAGRRYREAKAEHMPDDTIEGAELALAIGPTVERLIADGTLDGDALPLLRAVIAAICDDAPLALPWPAFHRPGG